MAADFGKSHYIDRTDIGGSGETAIVGDFNGDGKDDIGVYIPNGGKDARWVIKFNQETEPSRKEPDMTSIDATLAELAKYRSWGTLMVMVRTTSASTSLMVVKTHAGSSNLTKEMGDSRMAVNTTSIDETLGGPRNSHCWRL